METPVLATLRPLRLGELLDRAIRLYRANFLTFLGIIALVYVPLMVIQTGISALTSSYLFQSRTDPRTILTSPGYWIAIGSGILIGLVRFILVQGIATGALTRAVADNYLGKKTGILDAYRGIGKSWPTLLGALMFLVLVIVLVLIWWIVIPCVGWLTGLGMLVFVSAVINPLVPPVIVLERQGIVASVRRAWSLARRRFWPVVGYVLVLSLFSLLVVNGPVAIANVLFAQVFRSYTNPTAQLVMTSIIQGLVSLVFILIYYPLQMTAFTLIYFDLRVRTEGFDLALLTMDAENTTDLTEVTAVPVPHTEERLITAPELGNFAILTLAGVGIYIFFVTFVAGGVLMLASLFN